MEGTCSAGKLTVDGERGLVVHMDMENSFRFPGWSHFYSGALWGCEAKSGHVSKEDQKSVGTTMLE